MRKNDFIIVGILVVMMFAWMKFYPVIEKKYFPRPEQPVAEEQSEAAVSVDSEVVEEAAPVLSSPVVEEVVEAVEEKVEELAPETLLTVSNTNIELTVSSHGGAVVSAVLVNYPELNTDDSGPVVLDFDSAPALRYAGLPLSAGFFEPTDNGLLYKATLGGGHIFTRTFQFEGDYLLTIEDEFVNSSDVPWALPALRLPTGPMANPAGVSAMRGMTTLGIDTFAPAEGVTHWGKKFSKMRKGTDAFSSTPEMLADIYPDAPKTADWIAAKNKFFVQILTPQDSGAATGFDFFVRRDGEGKNLTESEVSAALQFDSELIDAGESFTRSTTVYIGPKDFGTLKTLGMEQTEVMEFRSTGFFKFMNPVMYPIKLGLLWGLTHFAIFGSYGIAILILTVIVRVLFWPLTHKSTESMKRMQALQPQMAAIKEKYKDNPQRMQQETMALYKENKVNPMGGCLPMLIQIPVFIALFAVLRSAIELRYSGFLWISDLSEPENLFAGAFKIPLVGWDSLNILPIFMAATMFWQQKLTSGTNAAATPEQQQQQKMMTVMMPIMMLFFFYNMPSGLVLYWTTSQIIMIAQLLIRKKKEA